MAADVITTNLTDQLEIGDLIRRERLYRDLGKWDDLAELYAEDSHVRTTWFDGTGKDFAAASKEMAEQRSRHSKHPIWPAEIRVNGDRAVSESLAEIQNRDTLEGVWVDTTQYCRFISKLVRTECGWRFKTFEAIYQKDTIQPVYPGDVPPIDRAEVESYRASYRIWAYMLSRKGYEIPQDERIVSEDRPDLVAKLYAEHEKWLADGTE
jgi:hypothetical protein